MRFEKVPTLAYLLVLPLLIALGVWQLGRAEEKRLFLKHQAQGLAVAQIVDLSTVAETNMDRLRYKKVQVTGHYDVAHQFLIDNQFSAGQVGYWVMTPFILQGEARAVLVNRGWLALNQDRAVLPDVRIKNQQAMITGRINRFPAVGIKLAGAEVPTNGWPAVVQLIETGVLAKKLAYPLLPFQIELDKGQPEGYRREWQTARIMLPEQHTAYALQWFALAITLTLLFFWYSFKSTDD
jgi:surfeit locus 1 family protein